MDNHKYDPNPEIEDWERKATELVTLMFSLCEERTDKVFIMPDALPLRLLPPP